MMQKALYTGGGVSLSPMPGEGRTVSSYVRLIADEGMAITNGETVTTAMDVPAADAWTWSDCEAPPDPEEPDA